MPGTQQGSSISALISTLAPTLIISIVFMAIFTTLRKKQARVYEPKYAVDSVPQGIKPDESPRGLFGWLGHLLKKPESFLIRTTGTDGYFFIRLVFGFAAICFMGCLITWPVLFPVNATHGVGKTGFDILSYSNVGNKWKTFAHVFISWIFFGAITFFIYREIVYYTTYRHVLQTTPLYDSLLSSRTLMLTEIPESMYDEVKLREYFPTATNIWHARDFSELEEKVNERTKLAKKYEGALNGVVSKAVKLRAKSLKKNKPVPEPADDLDKYLKDGKKRPTHRLKFLIGEKVDTLNYGVERLGELNKEIKKEQLQFQSNKQIPAVFIEFPSQLELQKAYQAIPFNSDFKGVKRLTSVAPSDIIWENLSLTATKRRIKRVICNTILTLMVIFWAIPVAVVGAISNINLLTNKVHFLRFINNMPKVLLGVITGLLPVVALAILMSLVPPFIKKLGKVSGCLTIQQVEAYCQSWYFGFLIVNVFLVVTVTSAAASSVTQIVENPTSALKLLGAYIPPASNFYLAYYCLQGLTITSGILVQIVALILAQFLGRILDKTPRSKWNRHVTLGEPGWSTTYANYQLLGCIALIYAIIAPLLLGFACIAFILIYIAWNYNLVYVLKPNSVDARGRNYPKALLQLFVGIYLGEVCLIALFVFQKNWACVVLEAVWIAVTVAAHLYIKWKFVRLFDIVPISAIKYAAGDVTYQYPMYDQGFKEIKTEGENYWNGGNQLGLEENEDSRDQVLQETPLVKEGRSSLDDTHTNGDAHTGGNNAATIVDSDSHSKLTHDSKAPFNRTDQNSDLLEKNGGYSTEKLANVSAKSTFAHNAVTKGQGNKGVSWFTRFFFPKTESFDLIRSIMPEPYFNYVEYNAEFLQNAYNDPCVRDEEPHIWAAKDDLGLCDIEKNKALENGVDVNNDNTEFDEKNNIQYTGPPPTYEEALRV